MKTNKIYVMGAIAGVLAILAVALGRDQQNPISRSDNQHLEGSWIFKVSVSGVPTGFPVGYTSLITFNRDGGIVQSAWVPPGTTAPSAFVGVSPWIGHGEWARTGESEFALTVLIPRFDSAGNFVGLAKSRASIELHKTRREADGRFAGDIFDAGGNLVLTGFGGTVHATRLQVEGL